MSATVAQYPVEPHVARTRRLDSVSAAKKQMTAHVRAATTVVAPTTTPLLPVRQIPTHKPLMRTVQADPVGASERVALVLDMDECLVHSKFVNDVEYRQNEYRPSALQQYADTFEIEMDDGERAVVHKRPGLDRFLAEASQHFDVYVFTAGLEAYGKPILDALDPKGTLFAGRFFRASCQQRKGMFLKDLRVVRPDLSKVILVDPCRSCCSRATASRSRASTTTRATARSSRSQRCSRVCATWTTCVRGCTSSSGSQICSPSTSA
jgi:Dullard-like phosphatase family protein